MLSESQSALKRKGEKNMQRMQPRKTLQSWTLLLLCNYSIIPNEPRYQILPFSTKPVYTYTPTSKTKSRQN